MVGNAVRPQFEENVFVSSMEDLVEGRLLPRAFDDAPRRGRFTVSRHEQSDNAQVS